MKKHIKSVGSLLARLLFKRSIIFESKPFYSDNTKPVYDELVKRGYDKKYNFFWYISNNQCATIKNDEIEYWNPRKKKSLSDIIRYCSYSQPKCIICCNSFLPHSFFSWTGEEKDAVSVYLTHGTPMKSVKAYYSAPEEIDYSISPAPAMNQLISSEFGLAEKKVYATGFPRNDVFAKPGKNLNQIFGWKYKKIIIWYPTFRQNKSHSIDLSGSSLPLIHNEDNAVLLNKTAKENKVLIIIKPHFAQDVSVIRNLNFSNIKLIDDSFFPDNKITSYELLAGSDALLTDYSSVYFDYTLHDKPIGVIWEDLEEYEKNPGFAIDLSFYLKGAEKIYSIHELCDFVSSVADGEDHLINERREICDMCNYANDGKNTDRVVDFIIENASL